VATLEQYVPAAVINSLSGFGFQIEERNPTCSHFVTLLRNFVLKFCDYYEREIDQQLAKPECAKTRDDLVSWANDEVTGVLFDALGRYRERIATQEIRGDQKIRCETALTYFVWLLDLTETVKQERKAAQDVLPLSPRFRKKRKSHPWTPYAVDVLFNELRKLFGR
jgi:hypothetical protein